MEKKTGGTDKFTWVSFFEELADKVLNFRNKQADLIEQLKNTGLYDKGLNDKDKDGNPFPMNEIDPFSFFSSIVKFTHDKNRTKVLGALKEGLSIAADLPADYYGIPASMPMKALFVGFKAVRQPTDIPALWELFEAALKNDVSDGLFENALNIKNVGFSKLTQGLFWVRPRSQFPIDSITTPFLKKHSIVTRCKSTKKYSDYSSCLTDIKSKFDEPYFELSFIAWTDTRPNWLKDILKKHCSEERIEFRRKNEMDLLKLLNEQKGRLTSEQWIDFFKKLNMDYWSGKITSGRFGLSFKGNNRKLLLEDIDGLNKWTTDILNCPADGLKEILDDFWAKPLSGSGTGFPTILLYLRDPKAYNIWLPQMQNGFKEKVGSISATTKTSKSYFKYNSKLIQFGRKNNLEPQTLDIIFCVTDDPPNFSCPLNQILYGPPGTGKTYQTVNYALSIIEKRPVNELIEEESSEGRAGLLNRFQEYNDNGQIQFITFHQNYAYEDFIQGLRPVVKGGDGTLAFELPESPPIRDLFVKGRQIIIFNGEKCHLSCKGYSYAIRHFSNGRFVEKDRGKNDKVKYLALKNQIQVLEKAPYEPIGNTAYWENYFRTKSKDDDLPESPPIRDLFVKGRQIIIFNGEKCHLSCKGYSYAIRHFSNGRFVEKDRGKNDKVKYLALKNQIQVLEKAPYEPIGNTAYWENYFRTESKDDDLPESPPIGNLLKRIVARMIR